MCGRVAYSARAIAAAADQLSNGKCSPGENAGEAITIESTERLPHITCSNSDSNESVDVAIEERETDRKSKGTKVDNARDHSLFRFPGEVIDRPNVGPGGEFLVFRRKSRKDETDELELANAIWGLLPTNGTRACPHRLPSDPSFSASPHFTMFNARSETVYDKRSFSGLIRNGQTCVLAVRGYYEWTKSKSSDKKKQPYFICNKNEQPVLLAGLWSCVQRGDAEGHTITTFTIMTTDANPEGAWIHPRQPIMLWDTDVALEWLLRPSHSTVEKLRTVPVNKGITNSGEGAQQSIWKPLSVYPVSKQVNSGKYQGDDCTSEVKLEMEAPSIKSFFSSPATKRTKTEREENERKRSAPLSHRSPGTSLEDPEVTTATPEPEPTSKKRALDAEDGKEKSWACSVCTYVHVGPKKLEYLACEVCGSERTDSKNVDGADALGHAEGERKRKSAG